MKCVAACGLLFGALTLAGWLLFPSPPEGTQTKTSVARTSTFTSPEIGRPNAPAAKPYPPDRDDDLRRRIVGAWTDNYQGKRTMTLKEDGTGEMIVELSGLKAALFAKRLQFHMTWTLRQGRLQKQTIGGEPADKVKLILTMMGDRVDEAILDLTDDHLLLLDQDGKTKYAWTRLP